MQHRISLHRRDVQYVASQQISAMRLVFFKCDHHCLAVLFFFRYTCSRYSRFASQPVAHCMSRRRLICCNFVAVNFTRKLPWNQILLARCRQFSCGCRTQSPHPVRRCLKLLWKYHERQKTAIELGFCRGFFENATELLAVWLLWCEMWLWFALFTLPMCWCIIQ